MSATYTWPQRIRDRGPALACDEQYPEGRWFDALPGDRRSVLRSRGACRSESVVTDPVVSTDDPYRCLDGRYHYRCEVGHNVASRSKLTKCPAPVTPVGNPHSCGAEMEHYIVDVEVDPEAPS